MHCFTYSIHLVLCLYAWAASKALQQFASLPHFIEATFPASLGNKSLCTSCGGQKHMILNPIMSATTPPLAAHAHLQLKCIYATKVHIFDCDYCFCNYEPNYINMITVFCVHELQLNLIIYKHSQYVCVNACVLYLGVRLTRQTDSLQYSRSRRKHCKTNTHTFLTCSLDTKSETLGSRS